MVRFNPNLRPPTIKIGNLMYLWIFVRNSRMHSRIGVNGFDLPYYAEVISVKYGQS